MKLNAILILLVVFSSCRQNEIESAKENGTFVISIDEKPVLSYQYEEYQSPEGIDPVYNRSGFIHPIKTLSGYTLTQIQPEDHYHHYGVWNPWTHVLYENDTLDFWNLDKREGTVRFAGFKNESNNGFSALHEHVVLRDGKEKVALKEIQTVEVHRISKSQYAVDFTLDYTTNNSPFKILAYRYGGFGFRATAKWNAGNSEIISSEVDTRDEIDGTRGKWCLVQGELDDDYGGVLLMSHPNNFNHPEPLRVWPEANHDGLIFVNLAPTKNMDWLLGAHQTYTLKYRIVVNNNMITSEEAEALWKSYAKI